MKKVKSLFGLMCLLVLAISSVCFTSCSSDDNDDNTTENNNGIKVVINGSTYSLQKRTTGHYTFGSNIPDCVAQVDFWTSKDGDDSALLPITLGLTEQATQVGQKLKVVAMTNDDERNDVTSGTITVTKIAKDSFNVTYILLNFDNVTFSNGMTINGVISARQD